MKRLTFLLIAICVISVRGQSVQTNGSYETAVASLGEANDAQVVKKAMAALEGAGTKAFPALLAHLNDKAKASEAFQRAEGHLDAAGNFVLHQPTIGEACFYLIQGQVEGNWPKAYRQYYFLSPENIVSWWQSRKEKSLSELRIEAARSSLAKAPQRRDTANYHPDAVRFLRSISERRELAGTVGNLVALDPLGGITMSQHKIFAMKFANVYPLYVQKAERKNRTKEEVDQIICWLTGYTHAGLQQQIKQESDFKTFFAQAPAFNPRSSLIKGVVCGVRVEEIEDPLMRKIRYLDKLIDELAKGKAMEKILRQ